MWKSNWLCCVSLIGALGSLAGANVPAQKTPAVEAPISYDRLMMPEGSAFRCFIPSAARREGEIRLFGQGSETRLQVLLYTDRLGRALREMRKSEDANWPEGKAWHMDSRRFLNGLDDFRAHLREHDDGSEIHLMIEFARLGFDSEISFYDARFEGDPDELVVTYQKLFRKLEYSGNYVASNQYFLVLQGFQLTPDETSRLLRETR